MPLFSLQQHCQHSYTGKILFLFHSSLPDYIEITHRSVNDGTVEGMRHKELPIFSVQYHPEASPGPTDNLYLFDEFEDLMRKGK